MDLSKICRNLKIELNNRELLAYKKYKIDSFTKIDENEYLVVKNNQAYKVIIEKIKETSTKGYRVYKRSDMNYEKVNVGSYPLELSYIGSKLVQRELCNI